MIVEESNIIVKLIKNNCFLNLPLIIEAIKMILKNTKIKIRFNSKRLSNHPVDKSNKNPRKNLNLIIHSPGLGMTLIMLGNKIHNRYGIENPIDIKKKILIIIIGDPSIENPTAVPRNGALHGVARSVEKTPPKNSLYL